MVDHAASGSPSEVIQFGLLCFETLSRIQLVLFAKFLCFVEIG